MDTVSPMMPQPSPRHYSKNQRSRSMYGSRSPCLNRPRGVGRRLPATPDTVSNCEEPLGDSSPMPMSSRVSAGLHRQVGAALSAEPFRSGDSASSLLAPTSSPEMRQPLRSQSFKHRPRPLVEVRRYALEDESQQSPGERRRSTPNISRRASLQRRMEATRTDVWPEPKAVDTDEKFLRLPHGDDYTRVRQFKIDAKGGVVSRGDSFRRKRLEGEKSPSPLVTTGTEGSDSLTSSPDPSTTGNEAPSTSQHPFYKVRVVGDVGTGKSSLISQFGTSEYRNAFATDDIEAKENTVSIAVDNQECDIYFVESNTEDEFSFLDPETNAFLLIYSIDSRSSFRQVVATIETIRANEECRNTPIVVAGNKVDLERRRAVQKSEVSKMTASYAVAHFEISVALNHDVDDLLIGLLAEIKEQHGPREDGESAKKTSSDSASIGGRKDHDDFGAAIRRYSQRKKKQMGEVPVETSKCTNLSPAGLVERFRNWRRSSSTPKITI